MKTGNLLFFFSLLIVFACACTPTTTEKTTEVKPPKEEKPHPATQTEEKGELSPCPKFSDAPNPDQVLEEYVLYRDFMKSNDWEGAFEKWKKVYETAPAADGKRNSVYADGIRFYERFISETADSLEKEGHIDKIFEIYDEMDKCYPEGGFVDGRKAFDYYYKYRHRATSEEIYTLFKSSIDKDGEEAQYFILNPFTALLVELFLDEKITVEEAKKYQQIVRERLAKGLSECQGRECERWKIIEEYVPARLEAFEGEKGFYGCEYYEKKYYPEFETNPNDGEVIQLVYSRLRFGGCPEEDEKVQKLRQAYIDCCYVPNTPCRDALAESRYSEAIECYKGKAANAEDADKKAEYLLLIAKIYHAHLKKFAKARQYARQAAAAKPNWGEPYLLIGRLYASSGPLCGPGRGWDSQIVVWPAIDMWNKAKRIDPASAREANKWIGRYAQYMPDKGEIFQRGYSEGRKFFVPCWIQEWTIIRAAK